ncbi:MAG: DNA-formamidopyrimidine glycosylase [Candidatus Binatus sp.]|jgi:formamidopyrimidine-DNA glycosylase|nr:DNA-formamidopyrimidine glycosylase [Candidatus Binatus sp.]
MPELPEVESLRRILARTATGRTIVSARIGDKALRRRAPIDFSKAIVGRKIAKISRRAKYLIVELDGDDVLLVHLGMSGSLTHREADFRDDEFDPRHDHIEFALDDATRLVYNDPRRFGMVRLIARAALAETPELKNIGPEPLSREFNADYLVEKARGKRVAIKNLIMDQRIVAGIGNIYASEILFLAGVRPTRRAGRVKRDELAKIIEHTPIVLRAAIGRNGTTFRSYRDSRGQPGRFAERLRVYGRENKPCYTCTAAIKNVVVGARASFYCPTCQK